MNLAPSPSPSLSARMRPPWASTIPLQMASPSPVSPPGSPDGIRVNFRNRSGSRSAGMPRPSSATDTATYTPSRAALSRITEPSGECRAALDSRLPKTCTMRRRSASTSGRSGSRSMVRLFPPPLLPKALRARSTSTATSAGSGLTASVPVSMPATSNRSDTNSFMWLAWSPMIWKNWRTTAGSRSAADSSTVAAEPLMEVNGPRSSWLTMARNSARSRSSSSTPARSCMATTTDSTPPSSPMMGVALSSTVTLRPSGTRSTISSAWTVSSTLSSPARGTPAGRTPARRPAAWSTRSAGPPATGRDPAGRPRCAWPPG